MTYSIDSEALPENSPSNLLGGQSEKFDMVKSWKVPKSIDC
jgi:hypothetical protein